MNIMYSTAQSMYHVICSKDHAELNNGRFLYGNAKCRLYYVTIKRTVNVTSLLSRCYSIRHNKSSMSQILTTHSTVSHHNATKKTQDSLDGLWTGGF